jgi:MFS transporter, OPA family, sugar phosphate sensor protein UhpC
VPLTEAHRVWRYRIFAATWLSYAGFYFCRQAYSVVKSTLGRELGFSTTELAHVWTAFLVAYMVGQFVSGALGRRSGPRLLLLVGMAVSLGCNVVFGFSNGLATFAGFMVLNGLAQASGWPGNVGAMAAWFRRSERGTVMGIWSTCYQLGSVAAKAFAAFMLGLWGWRWSFWSASLVLGIIWLLFLWLQRDRPEDVGLGDIAEDVGGIETPATAAVDAREAERHGFMRLLTNRTVLAMGLAYFCFKFLRYAIDSWLPYFLDVVYHVKPDHAGYASTVFNLAGFGGSLSAGWISDRYFAGRRAPVMVLMSIGMTIAYLLVLRYGAISIPTLVTFYGLIGFMLYGPDTLLAGAGAIDVSSRRDAIAAAGIINGLGSAGPIVQEQVVAQIYEASGGSMGAINLLMIAVSALGTLMIGWLFWRGRLEPAKGV